MDNIHVDKKTILTFEKKLLVLDLGSISLQTRTKLEIPFKKMCNRCKL